VLTTNFAARRLYERLGFVETGRDDTHIAMARRFER
jgi:RimJ/RimL family protein N-acetyltransferase